MSTTNGKLDGGAFVKELENCKTSKEIFALLDRTMPRDVLKERMANIDKLNDKTVNLILAFHAANAKANAGRKGVKTSHQDCVNMAVDQYNKLTGLGYKGFKAELNKYQTQKARNQSLEIAIDGNEFYKRVAERKLQRA